MNLKPQKFSYPIKGHPLARGLVGCWLMNEGSGTRLFDLSGNNNNGTLAADIGTGPDWTAGKFGPTLSFVGTNSDYVNLASRVTFTGAFSISCWIKATWDAAYRGIVAYGLTGTYPKIMQDVGGTKFYVRVVTSTDATVTLPSAGIWHHIVLTRDRTNKCNLIIDAGTPNSLFAGAAQAGNSLWGNIGSSHSTIYPWNGLIDDVQFWDSALSASEIAQLYRDPFCMFHRKQIWPSEAGAPPAGHPYYYQQLLRRRAS